MERTIKFRGKSISGDWIYGMPTYDFMYVFNGEQLDSVDNYRVDAETIGQFTGLKAGKHKMNLDPDVYEGDLFRGLDADDNDIFYVVMWIDQRCAFYMIPINHYTVIRDNDVSREKEFDWLFQDALLYDFSIDVGLMKVGNIHDNPEILKDK